MSDTPRTDSQVWYVLSGGLHYGAHDLTETQVVSVIFARKLERELAKMKDECTDLGYLNEALMRKLAYYERHSGRLCQDGQPCKKPGECEARGKCHVFKGTPMEGLTSKPDSAHDQSGFHSAATRVCPYCTSGNEAMRAKLCAAIDLLEQKRDERHAARVLLVEALALLGVPSKPASTGGQSG